jgi:hypothetical protein
MKTKKFMVLFTEDSSPKVSYFTTKDQAVKFANNFHKSHKNPYNGYWVDVIIEGKEVKTFPTWKEIEKLNN